MNAARTLPAILLAIFVSALGAAEPLTVALNGSVPGTYHRPYSIDLSATVSGGASLRQVRFYDGDKLIADFLSTRAFYNHYIPYATVGTHRYTVVVKDGFETVTSDEAVFEILPAFPPVIAGANVEDITAASASIDVTVLAFPYATTVAIEWGTTPAYGEVATSAELFSTDFQSAVIPLIGLAPDTTYHYRVTATHQDGTVSLDDATFTTIPAVVVSSVLIEAGKIKGSVVGTPLADAPNFHLTRIGVPAVTNRLRLAATGSAHDSRGRKLTGIVFGTPETSFAGPNAGRVIRCEMLLRVGDSVPGAGPGLVWRPFLREPFVDPVDDIGATGPIADPPLAAGIYGRLGGPGVTSRNDDVIAFFSRENPIITGPPVVSTTIVAREGWPALGVGTPGDHGRFKTFLSAALANIPGNQFIYYGGGIPAQRQLAFTAMLERGPGGVNETNDMGLWIWDGSQTQLVLREGQEIITDTSLTTLPAPRIVRSFTALRHPGEAFTRDFNAFHYPGLWSAGQFSTTVYIIYTDGTEQLATVSTLGVKALTTIGKFSYWAGLAHPAAYSKIHSWSRASNGAISILAEDSGVSTGVVGTVINGEKVVFYEVPELINLAGSPNMTADPAPVFNAANVLAFGTKLARGGQRWFRKTVGAFHSFFATGDPAPGIPGAVWAKPIAVSLPDGAGPVFTAALRVGSGDITGANDRGLWAVDSTGATQLLLHEGGTFGGKKVVRINALMPARGSPTHTRTHNTRRDVVAWLMNEDGTQQVVQFRIP